MRRTVACLFVWCCCGNSGWAQLQSFDLGPFGEVTTWLVGYAPYGLFENDPLEAIGGEAKFAAMSDPKLLPVGGRSLELPGAKPHEKTQIPWQIGRMVRPEHPEFLGAKIQRTMALLESGKYTHRPVRIMFYGQSIEGWWTELLVQRLRERYPETQIVFDNRAIGGWFVWRLQKTLKHDILRWQPDLVLFSAYQGCSEVWERFLSDLRRETTTDIVIRTS